MDTIILSSAFVLGYLVYRLGLPPMVGFLLAGLALSAAGFTSTPLLKMGADLGVTLLLFTIGLKLKIKNLLKPEVWGAGLLQMGLSVTVFGFALFCLGFSGLRFFANVDINTALLVGFALSFSSTVFAVKILEESGRMNSLNGRTAIGVLIIQDIVAVIYLTLSTGKMPSIWALLLIGLLPIVRKVFLQVLSRVGHGELMVLLGLFIALIVGAYSFEMVRLKSDLGALILGMMMASHPRTQELADALMSVKDVLLVCFFLDIGLTGLPNASGLAAVGILVVLLPLKMVLYFLVFSRFTLKARTSFVTTMNLSNYSEFGLIVCALAAAQGHIDRQWVVIIGIGLAISFIIASPLNKFAGTLFVRIKRPLKRLETRRRHPEERPFKRQSCDIIIMGMGRVGVGAYDWFQEHCAQRVLGFDFDIETVARLQAAGHNIVRADVTDPDFWRRMPAFQGTTVKLVILAVANLEAKLFTIQMLKKKGFQGKVGAVARYDDELEVLYDSGVHTAFNIFGEAGAGLATHVSESLEAFCTIDGQP